MPDTRLTSSAQSRSASRLRVDPGQSVLLHVRDALGDPVDMMFDGRDHIDQHRRAAGAVDGKQVRETRHRQTEIARRTVGPGVPERTPAGAADVQRQQRPGHRVEASGEDDQVEWIVRPARPDARRGDPLDRFGAHIDQGDIGPVVRSVIIGVEAQPLGAEGVVVRRQSRRNLGVFDDAANLFMDEPGDLPVGLEIAEQVAIDDLDARSAELPGAFEPGLPLLLGHFGRHQAGGDPRLDAALGLPVQAVMGDIIGANFGLNRRDRLDRCAPGW